MTPLFFSFFFRRWPAGRVAGRYAAPVLFGVLVLSGCGGVSDADESAVAPEAAASAPRTAPATPVKPNPHYATSGRGSYQEALQNYQRVGEALHGE